ncbi:sensor domain-containing protein [Mycobacterium sp. NPDC006124]|uniref:sensor domain-containing protein n=1 Tax=Mycobacterium sp. NPDC006124 TaxID=3156729 RepID=UPI0033A38546
MPTSHPRSLLAVCAAALTVGCTSTVDGYAVGSAPGIEDSSRSLVDVDAVLLEQSRMRAITGGGDDLTVIPTMDGKTPVDVDVLADRVPSQCAWLFAETQTFGREVVDFHKTTYQNPPVGALISQGAAAYRDVSTARTAFDGLVGRVDACGSSTAGYVGDWTADDDAIRTRTSSECGRDYRLKSVVLVEVTFCAYPPSVPDIVMTNVLERVPG